LRMPALARVTMGCCGGCGAKRVSTGAGVIGVGEAGVGERPESCDDRRADVVGTCGVGGKELVAAEVGDAAAGGDAGTAQYTRR